MKKLGPNLCAVHWMLFVNKQLCIDTKSVNKAIPLKGGGGWGFYWPTKIPLKICI